MPAKSPKSKTAAAPADAVPSPVADVAGETVTQAKPAAKPRARAAKAAADAGAELPAKTRARRAPARKSAAIADTGPAVVALDGDLLEQIRTEAYLIWLNEGQPHGRDHDHWVQAETAVRGRFVPMQQAAE